MEYCFARRYRLTKTDEFSSVFGFRRAIRGKLLMLHYLPRSEGQIDARLGLVIGKKQLRRAVDRNRAKRVIRERFRNLRPSLPPVDIVIRLAVKPQPFDSRLLGEDLDVLFGKLTRPRSKRETE